MASLVQNPPDSLARKRALVSCDRCKLRRTRCIRAIPDEPCSGCTASGAKCESTLPRKQRVYGSVETLSLRYRALEGLVKGLFPGENTQDTETLFQLAAARNIPMPAADDFSPSEIFSTRQLEQQQQQPYPSPPAIRVSTSADNPSSASASSDPNPFLDTPVPQPIERLTPVLHGVPQYFGSSSSFKLATTIRNLVARCNAVPEARSLLRCSNGSTTPQSSKIIDPQTHSTTNSSGEPYPGPESSDDSPNDGEPARKRARLESERAHTESECPPAMKDYSHDTIADLLPPRSVADALVSAFFEHIHLIFPVFNRNIFQFRYETAFARKHDVLQENEETGWLCCLALVFAFGAQALEKHDPDQARELQRKYLGIVHSYFRRLVTTTSLVNIQALLLLQLYDHNVGKRNSSWILIGIAVRMAMTLGMHREGTNWEFDPIERNTRRLVWWTLYIFEKVLCIILGRPSAIDDAEVSTKSPDETVLESREILPDLMGRCHELVSMSYEMRRKAYFSDGSREEHAAPVATAKALLKELDDWYGRLPNHLRQEAIYLPRQKRSVYLIHVYYNYIRCVVTNHYLIQKVERNICRFENKPFTPSDDIEEVLALAEECVASALECLKCLNKINELGFLNGVSWLDVFYIFYAVLIVCVDFLARPKVQPESTEDIERRTQIRKILHSTQLIRLAPTYHTLSHVAIQFASITGALDESVASYQLPPGPSILSPAPQPVSFGHGPFQSLVDAQTSDWDYENQITDIPWDFFDLQSDIFQAAYAGGGGAS